MQTATSEAEIKSRDLSKCVHHYTLRAPCPRGQGIEDQNASIALTEKPCGPISLIKRYASPSWRNVKRI